MASNLFLIWKIFIRIDTGSKIIKVVWKSFPNISSMGVPKSNTPVPKMDCNIDVTIIVMKISESIQINFISVSQDLMANLI